VGSSAGKRQSEKRQAVVGPIIDPGMDVEKLLVANHEAAYLWDTTAPDKGSTQLLPELDGG
jgi:hypothetical protein